MSILPKLKDLVSGYGRCRDSSSLESMFTRTRKLSGAELQIAMTKETLWARNLCGNAWIMGAFINEKGELFGISSAANGVICSPRTFLDEIHPYLEDDVGLHLGCDADTALDKEMERDHPHGTYIKDDRTVKVPDHVPRISIDPERYASRPVPIRKLFKFLTALRLPFAMKFCPPLIIVNVHGKWVVGAIEMEGVTFMANDLLEATDLPEGIENKLTTVLTYTP